MLSNAYFLANFRFDTAENEPAKNFQIFAKIFANFAALCGRGRGQRGRVAAAHGEGRRQREARCTYVASN